jgi:hypothetical protein
MPLLRAAAPFVTAFRVADGRDAADGHGGDDGRYASADAS